MSDINDVPGSAVELDAVAADEALLERLRSSLFIRNAVVWGDEEEETDSSYALLRAFQQDVSTDLPVVRELVQVSTLVPRRRTFGRGATVAAVTVGVLSLAGVAAAATAQPGDPLYAVRHAVSSAVHSVLAAAHTTTPTAAPAARPSTATSTSPAGAGVSAAARSASAVRQIDERLATATRLIAAARWSAARVVLDDAQGRLALVTDASKRTALAGQIQQLRMQLPSATQPPAPAKRGHGKTAPRGVVPDRTSRPRTTGPGIRRHQQEVGKRHGAAVQPPPARSAGGHQSTGKSGTGKTATSKTGTDKTATGKSATGKTAPAKTAPGKTAPAKTATGKTATSKAVSESPTGSVAASVPDAPVGTGAGAARPAVGPKSPLDQTDLQPSSAASVKPRA